MATDPGGAPAPGQDVADLRREIGELRYALESRMTIGQATGMLMERYKVGADRAWRVLVRASQTRNIKIRDLAAKMTADPGSAEAYPEKWPSRGPDGQVPSEGR